MHNMADEIFNQVVFEAARLMFGNGDLSAANIRLVTIALEANGLKTFIERIIDPEREG